MAIETAAEFFDAVRRQNCDCIPKIEAMQADLSAARAEVERLAIENSKLLHILLTIDAAVTPAKTDDRITVKRLVATKPDRTEEQPK